MKCLWKWKVFGGSWDRTFELQLQNPSLFLLSYSGLDTCYAKNFKSSADLGPVLVGILVNCWSFLLFHSLIGKQNWYSYQFTCLQVFEFLKKKDFVAHILKHLATSAISDLLLRLITCVEGTNIKQGLLDVSPIRNPSLASFRGQRISSVTLRGRKFELWLCNCFIKVFKNT